MPIHPNLHGVAGRRLGVVALAAILTATAGCEVAGVVADVVGGGGQVDAVYELPDRPTLVLVDDPANRLPRHHLADIIAGRIGDALKNNDIVEQVVPTTMAGSLEQRHDDFDRWPIDKVGQHAGAQQVIYVLVQAFSLRDEAIYRPTARVHVKVIDAASGARLFPPARHEHGYPVARQQQYTHMDGATATTEQLLGRRLAETLARDIGRLFHPYPKPQPGERLPG